MVSLVYVTQTGKIMTLLDIYDDGISHYLESDGGYKSLYMW